MGISTGFHALDDLMGGFRPTELTILASRPSMGKTRLALDIAHHVAVEERSPVAIFSLEMPKEQCAQWIIGSRTKSHDLTLECVGNINWYRIIAAPDELHRTDVFIDDTTDANTDEMVESARKLDAEQGPLGLIVVDYLQTARSSREAETRIQENSQVTAAFKALARELKCPVLVLSALPTSVEQRDDKRPTLSDLWELGVAEEQTDNVLFVYRASYYRPQAMKDGIPQPDPDQNQNAEVIVAKQSQHRTGTIKLAYARFGNLVHG